MEFTFTTLVTFGGVRLVPALLLHLVRRRLLCLDDHSAEFRHTARRLPVPPPAGNVFGEKTFDVFLTINGIGPCCWARPSGRSSRVQTTVDRLNLANGAGSGSATVISQWTTPWHGLEALDMRNVALGWP